MYITGMSCPVDMLWGPKSMVDIARYAWPQPRRGTTPAQLRLKPTYSKTIVECNRAEDRTSITSANLLV